MELLYLWICHEPDNLLYPYEESFEENGISFKVNNIIPSMVDNEKLEIVLSDKNNKNQNIINEYDKRFKIHDIYNEHIDIVTDIMFKKRVFTEDTCESIFHSYSGIFHSPQEVKELVLGKYEVEDLLKTPLAKLRKDILMQQRN